MPCWKTSCALLADSSLMEGQLEHLAWGFRWDRHGCPVLGKREAKERAERQPCDVDLGEKAWLSKVLESQQTPQRI